MYLRARSGPLALVVGRAFIGGMSADNENFDEDERDAFYESEARTDIQHLLENITFDEADGKVFVSGPWGHEGREAYQEFDSADALRDFLVKFGDEVMTAKGRTEGGEPVFEMDSSDIVDEELAGTGVYEFFESKNLVVPPDELLVQVPAPEVALGEVVVKEVSDELIKYLAKHPDKMRSMAPRKFEGTRGRVVSRHGGTRSNSRPRPRMAGGTSSRSGKDAATTLLTHVERKRQRRAIAAASASALFVRSTES